MSIAGHLIHTCRIQRLTTPNRTSLQTSRPVWTPHLTGQACRLVTRQQQVLDSATGEQPILTTYLLLLPAETDVRAGDRVTDIVDERGATELSSDGSTPATFGVRSVAPRRARAQRHVSVILERGGIG